MPYQDLAARLERSSEGRTVTALPDGSVDVYYAAYDRSDERIESRAAFGERVADDAAVPVERRGREAGGQAVNMARQAHALGDRVALFGHLDDPVLSFEFEAVSMGAPSTVTVYEFPDGDALFADRSNDVADWTLANLRSAAPDRSPFAADAVCCGNWASVDRMTGALSELAVSNPGCDVFVLDPGNVASRTHEEVDALFGALAALDRSCDVVVSANRDELRYAAAALSTEAGTDAELVGALQDATGVAGVVLHETERAAVGTPDGAHVVPNLAVDHPVRHTGAGDRFGAGLAHALARDWGWDAALALGNLCASAYVATGDTGDRESLRRFLDSRR